MHAFACVITMFSFLIFTSRHFLSFPSHPFTTVTHDLDYMDVVILCNRARKAEEASEADFVKRQLIKEEEEELATQQKLYGKYSNRGTKNTKKRPSSGGGGDTTTASSYHGNFRYGKSFEKAKVGFFLQATRKVISHFVTTY